jgi:O-methyltransferase
MRLIPRELIRSIHGNARRVRWALSAAASPREFPGLVKLFRTVRPYTMVEPPRLAALVELCREIDRKGIEGAIVECGTCNGGTAGVLAAGSSAAARPLWLFDSFEGMPEPGERDGSEAEGWGGKCLGTEERVRELLRKLGEEGPRVRIVKGWFQDTFPRADVGRLALLHVDADWYESVRLCLHRFYDDLAPGGFVVLDDYGWWEGCRAATDEFLRERNLEVEIVRPDEAGAWFRKPPS